MIQEKVSLMSALAGSRALEPVFRGTVDLAHALVSCWRAQGLQAYGSWQAYAETLTYPKSGLQELEQ